MITIDKTKALSSRKLNKQNELVESAESLLSAVKANRTATEIESFSEKSRVYDQWKAGQNIENSILGLEANSRGIALQNFMTDFVEPAVLQYRKMVVAQKTVTSELWKEIDSCQTVEELDQIDVSTEVSARFDVKLSQL